jgi:hypothetical protein
VAVANEIVLEWQDSVGNCCFRGTMIDISGGGARIKADSQAQNSSQVSIRLKRPFKTDCVAARVVWREGQAMGLSFVDACPWDFNLAATMGLDFNGLFGLSESEGTSNSGD